jgi:NHLM bacteriocin system ABC transporter peptidase/ATP-binding protein
MEAAECGAAALGIVLAHHGRHVPLSILRRDCGVSRDGSRASHLVKAARGYGLKAEGYRRTAESVKGSPLPAVLHWGHAHFLVLEGFRGGRAFLNDPAQGRRSVDAEEFAANFSGVVLEFTPGPEFERGGRRPSVAAALARALRGSGLALAFCVLAGVALVAPSLAMPVLVQAFIDQVLIGGLSDWLWPILGLLLVTAVVQGLLMGLQLSHLKKLRIKLGLSLSGRFVAHVLRLPQAYFAQRYAGEVAGRAPLNDKVAQLLSGPLATSVIDCTMLVFFVGLMLLYDPLLTGLGVGAVVANVVLLRLVSKARSEANVRILQEEGKLGGVAIAGLQAIETIKASAREGTFFARWAGTHAKAVAARQDLALADQVLAAAPGVLMALTQLSVLVVGGYRVMEGAMTVGMLVALQLLLRNFQTPVERLVGMGGQAQVLAGDLGRLDDVLDHPRDTATGVELAAADRPTRLQGSLELRGVTFGYNPHLPPLIEGFDLRVRPGERVALVGGSGAGKSTLARLIVGLHRPWSGSVRLDGTVLEQVPRRVRACSVALVEQELSFFAGTVRENLTLWDDTIPEEDLVAAAKDAEIHAEILALPGGYEAALDDGARNLSGGQRQRLELARALVRRPSLLVLDEATAALDVETEARVDQNLRARGCAIVAVAHRLTTLRDADEVVVLEGGRVAERGRYDELRGSGGALDALLDPGGAP